MFVWCLTAHQHKKAISAKIKLVKKSKDSEQKCWINDKNYRSKKNLVIIFGTEKVEAIYRSNRADAEKKRTENGTLRNTRGNMSRCRRVIANGDSLRATSKIGFNPIIG